MFPNQVLNLSQFPLVSAAARIARYSVLFPPLLAAAAIRARLRSIPPPTGIFHSLARCFIFLPGFHDLRMSLLRFN